MEAWILMKGERGEGGHILGVYTDRELARGDFTLEAQRIHATFTINEISEGAGGAIHVAGGCDWLSLTPHPVNQRLGIEP